MSRFIPTGVVVLVIIFVAGSGIIRAEDNTLWSAIQNGNLDMVRFFLENGVNVNM